MTAVQLDLALASTGANQRGSQLFYLPAQMLVLLRRLVTVAVKVLPGQSNLPVPATIDKPADLFALLQLLGQDTNGHKLRLPLPLKQFVARTVARSARKPDGTLLYGTTAPDAGSSSPGGE